MFYRSGKAKGATWRTFILPVIILVIAGVLKIEQTFFSDPVVPTVNLPAVSLDEIKAEETQGEEKKDNEVVVDELVSEHGQTAVDDEKTNDDAVVEDLPSTFNLAVPFISQAPFGVWDQLHEEACEEASFLMAYEYLMGNKNSTLDPSQGDEILKDMVAQEERLGLGLSISVAEAATFLNEHYYAEQNVRARIVENPSVDELKAFVAKGIPVIVPAAGRELKNPFFTGEGPLYHMLVIKGYTKDGFITNDPGTRHGQNYFYSYEVLMDALADWNNGDPVNGAKRVILLEPKVNS